MTKKLTKDEGEAEAKNRLGLKKQTMKDLGSLKDQAAALKGGACHNGTCNASK